jgi:aspartyl-tRNA(Asn)/glutamyl-tRNA(Gln) amidotransferase subunit C
MSIDEQTVRHIAALARLGLDPAAVPTLARELDGILVHMAELARPEAIAGAPAAAEPSGMPLRDDVESADPLQHARESFAPAMRDGFFLVPRLASHDSDASS